MFQSFWISIGRLLTLYVWISEAGKTIEQQQKEQQHKNEMLRFHTLHLPIYQNYKFNVTLDQNPIYWYLYSVDVTNVYGQEVVIINGLTAFELCKSFDTVCW